MFQKNWILNWTGHGHHAKIELNMEFIRNFHPSQTELYRVLVLSIATYGCETWTLKTKDEQQLLVFEMACLRKIWGVTRLDKIRNTAIRESLNFHISIVNKVRAKQLSYFGHVKRMPSFWYPKITLEGIIPGKRPRGRPPYALAR